jgi:hypothetical protein
MLNDEIAWVIEFPMNAHGVVYYGKTIEGLGRTNENADAIRFARKQDAEAIIVNLGLMDAFAVEHMWAGKGPSLLHQITQNDIAAGRILRGHRKPGCLCRFCNSRDVNLVTGEENGMDDNARLVLFQVAAFLKVVFEDKLVSGAQAQREASELSEKIGAILAL